MNSDFDMLKTVVKEWEPKEVCARRTSRECHSKFPKMLHEKEDTIRQVNRNQRLRAALSSEQITQETLPCKIKKFQTYLDAIFAVVNENDPIWGLCRL
jgi:hypothetical protein